MWNLHQAWLTQFLNNEWTVRLNYFAFYTSVLQKKKLVSALVIQFSMLLGYLYNSGSGFLTAAVDVAICCYCMVDFTISTFVSHVRGKKNMRLRKRWLHSYFGVNYSLKALLPQRIQKQNTSVKLVSVLLFPMPYDSTAGRQ